MSYGVFRRKTENKEAMQLPLNVEDLARLVEWQGGREIRMTSSGIAVYCPHYDKEVGVAQKGDYIVRLCEGLLQPVKREVFESGHEPVPASES